jgi:hypothetical protein
MKKIELKNLIKESLLEDTNAKISIDFTNKLYKALIKKLDAPAKKAGLRMSIFEQEFPIASSFYYFVKENE